MFIMRILRVSALPYRLREYIENNCCVRRRADCLLGANIGVVSEHGTLTPLLWLIASPKPIFIHGASTF